VYQTEARGHPLVSCRPDLEAEGMHPGMPLREAQLRWPYEPLEPLDLDCVVQAFEPVLQVLDAMSPFVESGGPGHAYMDASGIEQRYNTSQEFACSVQSAVRESTRYESKIGMASSKFLANIAARTARYPGVHTVPTGATLMTLGSLPVATLGLGVTTVQRLQKLGVQRIDQFMQLPVTSLAHRYGDATLRAYRGLHGQLTEPLNARNLPIRMHAHLDFEWVEHNPDRLIFACKMLTDHLAEQLARHHTACQRLVVHWLFDDGPDRQHNLRLADPTAHAKTLLRYLHWHVASLQVTNGIVGIRLRADDLVDTGGWQLKLLIGPNGRPTNAERRSRALHALGHLQTRWGENTARQAKLQASRIPEQAFDWIPVTLPTPDEGSLAGPGTMLPFWLLDPPQPVQVSTLPAQRRTLRIEGKDHIITAHAGPWRLHDSPWRGDRTERDYYQFRCLRGAAFLCFRDRQDDSWYLQGRYD